MKRLLQVVEGVEGDQHADSADQHSPALQSEMPGGELEQQGYRHDHAAHEVGDGGGDRGAQVGAKLLGGDGDKDRPVAASTLLAN